MIRAARQGDAEMLAQIHVHAWQETYPGLLPDETIRSVTLEERIGTWEEAIRSGTTRIAVADGAGFAQMGPQRDGELTDEYPEELWSIYVLRAEQGLGLGAKLFRAVREHDGFSALVLEDNTHACGFYSAMDGRWVGTRDSDMRGAPIRERLYVWDARGR